jgi:hypothetical protein
MPFHKFSNVFTAESPRTQRVGESLCLEEAEAFALATSLCQSKTPFSLRPLRLCGKQMIRYHISKKDH